MTCVMFQSSHIQGAPITVLPSSTQANRKKTWRALGAFVTLQSLPTDPAGTYTLRLQNIVPGSRYRVETLSAGVTLSEGVAESNDVNLTLQLYAAGSPYNDLRIKVRNASATPAYRPFESQAVAQLGTVTVFVFQEPDE